MYGAYAEYLVKFVQAYEAAGVHITALTPANEPGQQTDYPGMDLSDTAETDLLAKELFPRLASARLGGLKVLGFDYNWATPFPRTLLGDKRIAGKIDGIAYHCYGGSPTAMNVAHAAGKEAWVTECTSGSHPMRHGTALEQLIRSTRNWARAFLTWNVALGTFADGSDGFPHTGHGCTDCIGAVRIHGGKVEYTRDFSDLGHASKFVHPGATRIASNTFADYRDETSPSAKGGLEDVAFANTDGTIAVVAYNSSDAPITFQIRSRGQGVTYTLAARSPATFVWKP
jgi:glucosylceramidase